MRDQNQQQKSHLNHKIVTFSDSWFREQLGGVSTSTLIRWPRPGPPLLCLYNLLFFHVTPKYALNVPTNIVRELWFNIYKQAFIEFQRTQNVCFQILITIDWSVWPRAVIKFNDTDSADHFYTILSKISKYIIIHHRPSLYVTDKSDSDTFAFWSIFGFLPHWNKCPQRSL